MIFYKPMVHVCWKGISNCSGVFKEVKQHKSTIFALSSGKTQCALAVIRVSGPSAMRSLTGMTTLGRRKMKDGLPQPTPRQLSFTSIRHPRTGELLDRGMAVWLPAPSTYTGDNSLEFYVHGGDCVIKGILDALSEIPDYRLAEPGEFTRRAFINGKLDLSEAEGIADLLKAETAAQRKLALSQSSGSLHLLYADWRQKIVKAVASLEAFIDFSEDEQLEPGLLLSVREQIEELKKDLEKNLEDSRIGERLRSGLQIAIVGRPNVGKSSLLNRLCGDAERAIVTCVPGTTRDPLHVHMDIGGYPVNLVDTAGIRHSSDVLEEEGIRRARKKLKSSDVAILMTEAECVGGGGEGLERVVEGLLDDFLDGTPCQDMPSFVVAVNKIDLQEETHYRSELKMWKWATFPVVPISCLTGAGYSELVERLEQVVRTLCNYSLSTPLLTQVRHKAAVRKALEQIDGFFTFFDSDSVVAAQKLRTALYELGKITGAVSTEDILDSIFNDFCIGK